MTKIYRFLGNRGRTTIPYPLRTAMNLKRNDLVSFEIRGDTIVVRKEKICDGCAESSLREQMTGAPAGEPQKEKNDKTCRAWKTLRVSF